MLNPIFQIFWGLKALQVFGRFKHRSHGETYEIFASIWAGTGAFGVWVYLIRFRVLGFRVWGLEFEV